MSRSLPQAFFPSTSALLQINFTFLFTFLPLWIAALNGFFGISSLPFVEVPSPFSVLRNSAPLGNLLLS